MDLQSAWVLLPLIFERGEKSPLLFFLDVQHLIISIDSSFIMWYTLIKKERRENKMLEEFKKDHIRIGEYRIRALSFMWFTIRIIQSSFFVLCLYLFYVGLWLLME
jgi:sensor histidine kinase YesM